MDILSESTAISLRTFILASGWPILIIGSIIITWQGITFFAQTKGTIFGKLVLPTVLGWLITMYILGITATFYMFDKPVKGTLVVLPIFIVWFITFIMLSRNIRHWSKEAIGIKNFYVGLEAKISQRTSELAQANQAQQEKIQELDQASKLLARKDAQLQGANDSLRALDQAKTQFVSVAAHQLRTPLSVSKWTFQMLLSGDFGQLTKEQHDVLTRGNEMNEQMIGLVSDLLDVARIESGKLAYNVKPIDLGTFLVSIQNLYLKVSQEKNVSLSMAIPSTGQFFVQADDLRLRMVFQNLIDNAFKFTPSGGNISLTYEKKGEMMEFKIRDSGIGIAKEEIPRLFSKFFRARNAIAMDTRGTGLGLYIASSIIKTHGGTITVNSEVGKGTMFTFTIPARSSRDQALP